MGLDQRGTNNQHNNTIINDQLLDLITDHNKVILAIAYEHPFNWKSSNSKMENPFLTNLFHVLN